MAHRLVGSLRGGLAEDGPGHRSPPPGVRLSTVGPMLRTKCTQQRCHVGDPARLTHLVVGGVKPDRAVVGVAEAPLPEGG